MKKLQLTFLALCISAMSFAQVGIGTNTPTAGSILELKAADKALLLTRVATTAAVTTPVNGMLVYDISTNCIKGYQNGAWTDCLSACGDTTSNNANGGDWGFDFTFTIKQIASTFDEVSAYSTGCVTTDGKVFLWGRNWSTTFFNTSNIMTTPVYSPLPNGELAEKILMSAYVAMVLTTTGKIYVMGLDNYSTFGGFSLPRVWSQITIPGETSFVDFAYTGNLQTFIQSSSGKVYRCGKGVSNVAPELATTFTQMLFPVGVTSYTAIWSGDASSRCVFLKGNNNNIYAAGDNAYGQLGNGTITNVNFNTTPVKVLLPTGVNIVKISSARFRCLALTDTGVAYGWGYWKSGTAPNVVHYFAASPAPADISGNNVLKPSPIILPTVNSDTKFTDVWAGDKYSVVRTDKMVYFKGYNYSGIIMRPITSDDVAYGNSSVPSEMDMVDGTHYNLAAPVWNKFKTIITGGAGGSASSQFVFAISQDDRGFVWGESRYASGGIGGGDNYLFLPRPTPIATGIGDPINPNPLY